MVIFCSYTSAEILSGELRLYMGMKVDNVTQKKIGVQHAFSVKTDVGEEVFLDVTEGQKSRFL